MEILTTRLAHRHKHQRTIKPIKHHYNKTADEPEYSPKLNKPPMENP